MECRPCQYKPGHIIKTHADGKVDVRYGADKGERNVPRFRIQRVDEVQLAEWKEAAFVITGTVAAAALVTGIIGGVGKAVGEEATKAGVKAIKKKSKKSRRSPKSKKKAKPRATRKKRRGKKKKKRS